MFGNWFLGLKDEMMRKSKKELIEEISSLKKKLSSANLYKPNTIDIDYIQLLDARRELAEANEYILKLTDEINEWKQKYVDEVQKIIDLTNKIKGD